MGESDSPNLLPFLIGFGSLDPLIWLGLRKAPSETPNLSAIHEVLRTLLPEDEPVVIRYIVVVAVLLARVVHADGRLVPVELHQLRALFRHIDRMPPDGIDALCDVVTERVPQLDPSELEACFSELRALCNAGERREVLRVLATQAMADGQIHTEEHELLLVIARALGLPEADVSAVEEQARRESLAPRPPASVAPRDE